MKLKKSDWYSGRRSGEIKDDEMVKLWSLPHGARCSVSSWDGSAILKNGEVSVINSSIAIALADAGIEGDILINSTNSLPQTVSRWLTWWLSNKPTLEDRAFRSLRIAVFDTLPTKDLPFEVEVLKSYSVRASDVLDVLGVKSSDLGLSLLAVERANGDYYELEPIRYTTGTVLAFTAHGYVVMPDQSVSKAPIIINRVSRSTRAVMELNGITEGALVGSRVRLQYTMYTGGVRICNYKGAVIHSVDDLRWDNATEVFELTEFNQAGYQYESALTGGKPGLLTPARCGRANIVMGEGGFITALECDRDSILFQFDEEVGSGQYAVVLSRHGVQYLYRFNSRYNIDVLSSMTLAKHIDDNLYHSTGYSIDRLGLLYQNIYGKWFIDGDELDSSIIRSGDIVNAA